MNVLLTYIGITSFIKTNCYANLLSGGLELPRPNGPIQKYIDQHIQINPGPIKLRDSSSLVVQNFQYKYTEIER